ncbi:PREDICTED: uncharacterized protein LOC101814684 [Ficedula albicollis]|uniref:uncharacterized protein LOC101814684 n=1 Tax=Ficedula albicollis TaxID=59894 RepID=UPI0003594D8F|nr:PREDICTED: uncharacterized protein LOC101814684 [Ficedula albicollis]
MLESSDVESPELYEAGTSTALFNTPSTEQPVPFGTEAVMEAGTCFGSPVLGETVLRAAASTWQGSFVLHSYGSHPFMNYWPPMCWDPYSTRGVSGPVWTSGVEGITVPLSTVPQGGCVEASSERIIQQSDLQDESLTLRGGQLVTLESVPHSSSQTVFDNPHYPSVPAPCVEESQASGQSQVLEGPVVGSLMDDRYQAACLLCEFSASAWM